MGIKSKLSGILVILAALLLIGFAFSYRFMDIKEIDLGGAFLLFFFGGYAFIIIFASAGLFALIAIIFGIKILRAQSNERLISLNKRLFIAEFVLAPFVGVGLAYAGMLYTMSTGGLVLGTLTFASVAAYGLSMIFNIGTIIALKRAE